MSATPTPYPYRGHLWTVRNRAVAFSWDVHMAHRLAELSLPEDDPHRRFLQRFDSALQVASEAFDQQYELAEIDEEGNA